MNTLKLLSWRRKTIRNKEGLLNLEVSVKQKGVSNTADRPVLHDDAASGKSAAWKH